VALVSPASIESGGETTDTANATPPPAEPEPASPPALTDDDLEEVARLLLRRWGVVFRRLIDREGSLPPWRDLLRVLRRLEARGEIRGGRFVYGWSGEQFALPEAVPALRRHRRPPEHDQWIAVSGADPLNLVGILTAGARVPAISTNRVLYRNGRPAAVLLGRELRALDPLSDAELWEARKRLERRAPAAKAALAV
jgi:ATP-dependent Lhr-like helicase